jgi:membrane-associated phospholipid phosphatase
MNDFLRRLRRLVSWPPERRWWGAEWLFFAGFLLGSWLWIVEHKVIAGVTVLLASFVVEAILFHLFIKKTAGHGPR